MYLHIGSETIVSEKELIGIFDLENTSVSKYTRDFLRLRQQKGEVVTITDDIPKSFILCVGDKKKDMIVYLSQLAASTLRKRAENGLSDD